MISLTHNALCGLAADDATHHAADARRALEAAGTILEPRRASF